MMFGRKDFFIGLHLVLILYVILFTFKIIFEKFIKFDTYKNC